jgi:hypothetical protein
LWLVSHVPVGLTYTIPIDIMTQHACPLPFEMLQVASPWRILFLYTLPAGTIDLGQTDKHTGFQHPLSYIWQWKDHWKQTNNVLAKHTASCGHCCPCHTVTTWGRTHCSGCHGPEVLYPEGIGVSCCPCCNCSECQGLTAFGGAAAVAVAAAAACCGHCCWPHDVACCCCCCCCWLRCQR